jgi:hypothetical protein
MRWDRDSLIALVLMFLGVTLALAQTDIGSSLLNCRLMGQGRQQNQSNVVPG